MINLLKGINLGKENKEEEVKQFVSDKEEDKKSSSLNEVNKQIQEHKKIGSLLSNALKPSKEVENEVGELQEEIKKEEEKKKEEEIEEKEEELNSEEKEEKRRREEHQINEYSRFNYFFENKMIKNIKNEGEEQLLSNFSKEPTEARIKDKLRLRYLDKEQLIPNKKYFLNGIRIKSKNETCPKNTQKIVIQNVSVKSNEVRILGNEKMNRGKYKTMPEDIDIVIQEKFEEKKEEVNKHRENKTEEPTTQGDCIIFYYIIIYNKNGIRRGNVSRFKA